MMDDEHSTDRRVKFDFEVDFSNGGGLQGQDIRLDIEGEDMRLLMVQEVRILNKEIIADGHKRVEPSS
jgi:arylformamidase